VYYYGPDSFICVQGRVQFLGQHYFTLPVEQTPISVCMDGEYGYVICSDNHIRKFHLGSGYTICKWLVPNNRPFHHQMAVINGKIYYCNVNGDDIIIFGTNKESVIKKSIMSLGRVEKPCYIADNTKHQEETVIISGASGVAKFPVIYGFSEPKWFTRIEHVRGVCVDGRGLIYVAKCQPSMIRMLSQQTGEKPE